MFANLYMGKLQCGPGNHGVRNASMSQRQKSSFIMRKCYVHQNRERMQRTKTLIPPKGCSSLVQDDFGPSTETGDWLVLCAHWASGRLVPDTSRMQLRIFSSLLAIFSSGNRNT